MLTYDDAVSEALAFGWIDTKGGSVDDERTRLLLTPRRRGSGWSRPNKQRIERLEADGLMTPAGAAVIAAAKADGSWSLLDDVEDLVVPDDLAAAFDRHAGSREQWDALPAVGPQGDPRVDRHRQAAGDRATRVEQTASLAAEASGRVEVASSCPPAQLAVKPLSAWSGSFLDGWVAWSGRSLWCLWVGRGRLWPVLVVWRGCR